MSRPHENGKCKVMLIALMICLRMTAGRSSNRESLHDLQIETGQEKPAHIQHGRYTGQHMSVTQETGVHGPQHWQTLIHEIETGSRSKGEVKTHKEHGHTERLSHVREKQPTATEPASTEDGSICPHILPALLPECMRACSATGSRRMHTHGGDPTCNLSGRPRVDSTHSPASKRTAHSYTLNPQHKHPDGYTLNSCHSRPSVIQNSSRQMRPQLTVTEPASTEAGSTCPHALPALPPKCMRAGSAMGPRRIHTHSGDPTCNLPGRPRADLTHDPASKRIAHSYMLNPQHTCPEGDTLNSCHSRPSVVPNSSRQRRPRLTVTEPASTEEGSTCPHILPDLLPKCMRACSDMGSRRMYTHGGDPTCNQSGRPRADLMHDPASKRTEHPYTLNPQSTYSDKYTLNSCHDRPSVIPNSPRQMRPYTSRRSAPLHCVGTDNRPNTHEKTTHVEQPPTEPDMVHAPPKGHVHK
eukprot:2397797-Pleurochrysis_carterae.AAC.5